MPEKRRILLVDNEQPVRMAIEHMLQPLYETGSANNGSEAVQKLEDARYDLILVDTEAPGVNELLSAVGGTYPVVAMTADVDVSPVVASRIKNFRQRDVLYKPFGKADLLAALARHYPTA